ncbi:hypothetical protein FRC00_004508, partial [Tulasnella sp. 408]
MKYEGRFAGRNLLIGRTDAENAYILARHLQGETPAPSKEVLFFSTCRAVFGGLSRARSPTHPLWVALRETGLIETLLQVLIKQEVRESNLMPREEIDWGVAEALVCLSIVILCDPWRFDDGVKSSVTKRLGALIDRIHSEYGLKSKSVPEQLYEIQCVTVTTMGFLVSQFESDDGVQRSINLNQLASFALAVIFDPLADSNAIEFMTKELAHKNARSILMRVNAGRISGCYGEIAPLVVNKYIARCYTGMGLCAAVAPARALHSKFINDGKVHLRILQWFWKSFRGPQEIPPEDKEVDHGNHDLTGQAADVLSVLWAKKLIYDLVVEGDFIMAIGHWFFIPQTNESQVAACKGITEEIAELYGNDRQFVAVYIEPTWKQVFKSLKAAKRSGLRTWRGNGAEIWLFFGERLGLAPPKDKGLDPDSHTIAEVPKFIREAGARGFEHEMYEMPDHVLQLDMPEN